MQAVIDTRFLITHFIAPDDETKKWTKTTLENLQKQTNLGIIPTIVIHEFYKFEIQTLGLDVANIRANILLKSKLTITDLDPTIALEAARLRCKYADLPTADAIIAATAINSSSDFVLTDDKHIKQIKETKTKWIIASIDVQEAKHGLLVFSPKSSSSYKPTLTLTCETGTKGKEYLRASTAWSLCLTSSRYSSNSLMRFTQRLEMNCLG